MQLIAEAYDYVKRGLGLHEDEMADMREREQGGPRFFSSIDYITRDIVSFKDSAKNPLLPEFSTKAGQKGTGK